MKKTMSLLAIAGLVLALAPAAQAEPIVTPGDGYAGPYRLVFATSSHPMADASRDMDDFDTDVTAAANAVAELLALGTTWQCLGSTTAIDARDHTGTNPSSTGIPIYTTTGLRVADDNADLWDGTIQNAIWLDDGTSPGSDTQVIFENATWTGTNSNGTAASSGDGLQMGGDWNIRISRGGRTDSGWMSGVSLNGTDTRGARMYGISGVIPEPATMSLLAIGGIALIRRRRRA